MRRQQPRAARLFCPDPKSPAGPASAWPGRPGMPQGRETWLLRGERRVPARSPGSLLPAPCQARPLRPGALGRARLPARPSGEGAAGFVSPRRCDSRASPACSVFPNPHLGGRRRIRIRVPPLLSPPAPLPATFPLPSQPEPWVAVGGAGFADGCIYHAGGLAKWFNPLHPAGAAGSRLGGLPCWQLPSPAACLTGSGSPASTRWQKLPPSLSLFSVCCSPGAKRRCPETGDSQANGAAGPHARSGPNRARACSRGHLRPGCCGRS